MSAEALPHRSLGRHQPAARRGSVWSIAPRVVLALALLVLGVLVVANERSFTALEARLGTHLIQAAFADQAVTATTRGDPSIAFAVGADWWALRVTTECAIALYIGPLLAFAGLFVAFPSISLVRTAWALVVAGVTLVLLNQARLVGLGYVFAEWGLNAYDWAHSLVGSFLMIFGVAGCLTLFFFAVIRPSRRGRSRTR